MPHFNLATLDPHLAKMFKKDGVTYYRTQQKAEVSLDLYQDRDGDYMAVTTHADDPDELVLGQGESPKEAVEDALEERVLDEDDEDAQGDFIVPHDEILDLD